MPLQYIKQIIGTAFVIVIVGLTITISCQNKKIDSLKQEVISEMGVSQELRNDISRLQARLEYEAQQREKESTVVEKLLVQAMDIKTTHAKNVEDIQKLEENPVVLDWLDYTIPDDVQRLLQDITHSGSTVRKSSTTKGSTPTL